MRAFNKQVTQVSQRHQHMRARVDMRTFMNVLYAYLLEVHAYQSSVMADRAAMGELSSREQALLEAGEHLRAEGERWLGQ